MSIDDNRYSPPQPELWSGRKDGEENYYFHEVIQFLDLNHPLNITKTLPVTFAILGFCCDEGIRRNQGRTGAAEGPRFLRQMLAKLPILKSIQIYDAGNIICADGNLENSQATLAHCVQLLLSQKIIPIVIGGGHEMAYGHYLGLLPYLQKALQIINFDAHFDMRAIEGDLGNSGTPFTQIFRHAKNHAIEIDYTCYGIQSLGNNKKLFEAAKNHQVQFYTAEQMNAEDYHAMVKALTVKTFPMYVSICLDVFAAAYAPGVSSPQPLGLTPWQMMPLLKLLCTSGNVLSYDVAELSPKYDTDMHTAKLAAYLVSYILHHHEGTHESTLRS